MWYVKYKGRPPNVCASAHGVRIHDDMTPFLTSFLPSSHPSSLLTSMRVRVRSGMVNSSAALSCHAGSHVCGITLFQDGRGEKARPRSTIAPVQTTQPFTHKHINLRINMYVNIFIHEHKAPPTPGGEGSRSRRSGRVMVGRPPRSAAPPAGPPPTALWDVVGVCGLVRSQYQGGMVVCEAREPTTTHESIRPVN